MSARFPSRPVASCRRLKRSDAFSLVEMLVVMGVIVVLIGLAVPAVNSLRASNDLTASAYVLSGTLEQARAYAMANNTYVWVGFFEEDGSKDFNPASSTSTPTPVGVGRVVMSAVASRDGTRYQDTGLKDDKLPKAFDPKPDPAQHDPSNQVVLIQLGKLVRLEGAHLYAANAGREVRAPTNNPPRPGVDTAYQVGDPISLPSGSPGPFALHPGMTTNAAQVPNVTTFNYPLYAIQGSGPVQYTFIKIIEFNPQGEASKIVDSIINGPQSWMEIALAPARGNIPRYNGTACAAAVQVSGLNGRVRVFRP